MQREQSFGWSFPGKVEAYYFCVDGLMLWTGSHLHIKYDSHYFMFFLFSFPLCLRRLPALIHVLLHLPPVHWSAFQGISLFNICYKFQQAQVTISAALRCLLIFMSTCRNICFGVSFVNASSYLVWLATSCPLSLTLTKHFSLPNAW